MAESETRATVDELYRAYAEGDIDRVAALLHEDIDWISYAPITLFPFAGPRRGRTTVLQAIAGLVAAYRFDSYRQEAVIVEGERAAVISDVGFTQRATNRRLRFRVANFLRVVEGRLVEFRKFADTFDLAEQTLGRELLV